MKHEVEIVQYGFAKTLWGPFYMVRLVGTNLAVAGDFLSYDEAFKWINWYNKSVGKEVLKCTQK